ncbi:putative bifunctional diguanylate cyclase/phosphodiesterase [Massilia glaciei]|uniref:GGDEF domain-containing protein n=1 Tax=Massilia glaciei TaxID=1524097 RepID=A0A2U2HFS6_9BURK|nr:EAL domain-containing protein [Massilia glaciei]PWF43160.1 GGDEF domain-containing protein [Massilia glaciei]
MNQERPDRAPAPALSSFDVLAEQVAVVDAAGTIVAVNAAWKVFACANGGDPASSSVGANYLDVCGHAGGADAPYAARAASLLRDVIEGRAEAAEMAYPCDAPHEKRWFRLKITRAHTPGPRHVVAMHERIVAPELAERQLHLQAHLLASVEQAVIATDLSGTIVFWNPHAERLYGWSAAEALGRNIIDITPAESTQAQAEQIMARLSRGESWTGEFEVRHRSGRTIPVRVTDSPLRNEREELIGVIGISTDITEQRKIEKALRLSDIVYQAIGEAIMVLDLDDRIVAINPAFTKMTSYGEAEIIGRSADVLKGADAAGLIGERSQLLERTGHWAGIVWTVPKGGERRQEWLRVDTIYDERGRAKLRICMFSHVTDQKRAKETIWQQANFDALTGLPNRSMFRDRLEHEIQKAGRAGRWLALMFIDLDQFKEVNDTLGHDIGDMLLKQAAERLAACVRGVDTVARIGGDEFTVILGELDDVAIADRVARDIVRTMSQPFPVAQNTLHVSASVGITLYPEDAREADVLIKNADQAMYAAKNHGRDQFHYFTQHMQNVAQMRMRMINDLRGALANEQFEMLYQPIVVLATGALHKAEALLRWRHPARGTVNPEEFIPLAEQTGMIGAIGEWAYRHATDQARIWRKDIDPQFQVSVNLSPLQLRTHATGGGAQGGRGPVGNPVQFSRDVAAILEITEGLLLESNSVVLDQLQLLRDAGVQLAIDDFGTGYSALSYLRNFHVDYLKIDQTFVMKLTEHSDDLTMCEAIIAMAHKLGIKVIAEGIESEEQRILLARAGCDFGQGYLFARPLSAEVMGAMLAVAASRAVQVDTGPTC